jgi:DNA-binding CsgD family transcriptional regulator
VTTTTDLERGRRLHDQRAWSDAFEALATADREQPLGAADLGLLAAAAYMLGRDDDYSDALERAHRLYVESDDAPRAARAAFWLGINLLLQGQAAPANGWFARADRLVSRTGADCVERGYLLIPRMLEHVLEGDHQATHDLAAQAVAIGERFDDDDLVALTAQEQAHALLRMGRTEEGLRLLDETMLLATSGALSPIVTGLIYCNTIAFCQSAYELRRAREWTDALSRWCEEQPDMVAHTGICLVHRAEILELSGAWADALEEARRAYERLTGAAASLSDAGYARYRQGEVHRLQGDFAKAEAAYTEAADLGFEPQPGLALMRLGQGRTEAAVGAIRRALGETSEPFSRLRLLPGCVEICLAGDDLEGALEASRELAQIAERYASTAAEAASAQASGAVRLAEGDPQGALATLRRSFRLWRELGVPHEAARVRTLIARACAEVGDEDGAELELGAARRTFTELGAALELARLDSLGQASPAAKHGLTERELEVLRLVAAGKSNREIAAHLVISEHTVARHVQNIFAKLGVSSRTAASAFAFEHRLV